MEDQKINVKKEKDQKSKERYLKKSREMAIRRENPFSLFQDIDRYFNDLSRNLFDSWFWPTEGLKRKPFFHRILEDIPYFRTPLANVIENDIDFIITAELPGLDKSNVDILIHDDVLEIKGKLTEEKKDDLEGELVRKEYRSSSYYRCFKLPENIDSDKIEARLENGILNISIPKKAGNKQAIKKIEIT